MKQLFIDMFCPKCGFQNELDVKFCRDCGQDLNLITKAIQKSTPIRIVGQFADELKQHNELLAKPSLMRGTKFTILGLIFLVIQLYFWFFMNSRDLLIDSIWLLFIFYFLGIGIKEFVKYRRSIAAFDAREANLELASQNTQTPPTAPLIPPSATESTTQTLISPRIDDSSIPALNTKGSID